MWSPGGWKTGQPQRIFGKMTNGTQAIVHFICPHCDMIYVATQKKSPEQLSGDFHCGACGISVHEWTGFYDFSDWKQVTMKPMR